MKKQNILKIFFIFVLFLATLTTAIAFSVRDITLNFVQLSDVHLCERQDTSYKALSSSKILLADAIKQINLINGVDFVAFTGDMVDYPSEKNYNDFFLELTELKYPAILAYGNHEIGAKDGENQYTKQNMVDILRKYNKNYPFDKSYYAFSPKRDYRVIVLDLTIDDPTTANGQISDEQLTFLDNELNENKNKVVVIFQHHPVVPPFISTHHDVKNADKYLEVIKKYDNPIVIFSGHYHSTKITQEDNVIHVSSPSLVTYPNAFRYIKITNYNEKTIFDFYFYETKLLDVQAKSRANAIATGSFSGNDKDRLRTITISKNRAQIKRIKEEKQKEEEMTYEEFED